MDKGSTRVLPCYAVTPLQWVLPESNVRADLTCLVIPGVTLGHFSVTSIDVSTTGQSPRVVEFKLDSNDFPILAHSSSRYGFVFVLTRLGYLLVVDLDARRVIATKKFDDSVFMSTQYKKDGILAITKSGGVSWVLTFESRLLTFL